MAPTVNELLEINLGPLNKPDLAVTARELQEPLRKLSENPSDFSPQNVLMRLNSIENNQTKCNREISTLKKENSALKKRVIDLEDLLDDSEYRFIEVEKAVSGVAQYSRRENFEISGIPAEVPHAELQTRVLNIVNSITDRAPDMAIKPSDIHACHRLKKEDGEANPKVIVRMVNRQNTIDILKSKKKLMTQAGDLGYDNLFINENLFSEHKNIFDEARKLKKNNHIKSCWTFNGIIHVKKRENDPRGKKIFHIDFENYFTSKQLGWD